MLRLINFISINGLAILALSSGTSAQVSKPAAVRTSAALATSATTRYFQLTVVLKYPPANGSQEPRTESITTQLAVFPDRSGSSKTRMTSQVPFVMAGTTKYIELGTKLDCNEVHLDNGDLALSIVLETSIVNGSVTTKNSLGLETEEPLISARNLVLAAKLPLDTPKIVFDTKNVNLTSKLTKLEPVETPKISEKNPDPTLQIEVTAHELK